MIELKGVAPRLPVGRRGIFRAQNIDLKQLKAGEYLAIVGGRVLASRP